MSAREVYQKTKKVPDLLWNLYVCRPIAAVIVDAIKSSRVTPNQITLLSFLVAALSAGLLMLAPGYWGLVAAILVYEFSYVLDCVDGMLARWRGIASAAGHLLDFLMDEIKAFLILAAATSRLHSEQPGSAFLHIGLFGLVALASGIALTSFLRHPEIAGAPTGASASSRHGLLARVEALAKLLIHYPSYIWLAALLGRLELYVYPYVAVCSLYAARTWLLVAIRFGRRC